MTGSILLSLLSLVRLAADTASWPEPRGNAQLTAWQKTPGKSGAEVREMARLDLGRGWATLSPISLEDGRILGVAVFGGAAYAFTQEGKEAWFSHPKGLNLTALKSAEDLDGDGDPELLFSAGRPAEPYSAVLLLDAETGALIWRYDVEPMSYSWTLHVDHYLADAAGKQIIVLMQGYPPDPKNGYLALFAFPASGKPPEQRWRYDFDAYTCFPTLYRTDLDGDDTKEIAVETHSRMWFLEAATGTVKHFAQWDTAPANTRSYGLTKFVDLDKDGREDFLCIANFAQHHEVLLNRDGKMVEAWHHGWAESVTIGKVATRYPPVPDVDVDGDGKTEIVLSMFNAEDKPEWALRVYDALTGELKYRAPGAIAVSCVDVNGDGAYEILSNLSTDPTGTTSTGARLWKVRDGALADAWDNPDATALDAAKATLQVGTAKMTLLHDVEKGYVLAPLPVEPTPAQPEFANVPATVGNTMPTLLAAPLDAAPGCELVVYSEPKAAVYALVNGAMEKRGEYASSCAPAVADLDGDGSNELVLTTALPDAQPAIEALTPVKDNALLWKTEFPAPDRAGLPAPRKAYVRTLCLTGKPTPDLYVWFGTPVVRSLGIHGTSGTVLWEKGETPGMERYWGPSVNHASAWDQNSDGKEDLVFTNPDYFCIADGPTGNSLLGPANPPDVFHQPSQGLYTYPAILSRSGQLPLVCLVDGHYFLAGMTIDTHPLWYKLPAPGDNRCAAEAFMQTRDGQWRMGYGRQNGRFACLDATTGEVLIEADTGSSASDVIAWDSDGDGAAEFVFGDSHGTLHRLGIGEDGVPQDAAFPLGRFPLGAPIAADFDGDGACELAVPTADGYVLLLQ